MLVLASRRLFFFLFLSFSRRPRLHRTRKTTRRLANAAPSQVTAATMTCSSKPGERTSCAADTSAGVVLLRSTGDAPCLLGRTWGYDQTSVWVSDGCSAEFVAGPAATAGDDEAQAALAHSERRLPALRRREGPDLFPAFQLRAVSQPAESRRDLRRRLRQHAERSAAPGHPAAEVLRAVLGLVPHAEDALLPLRLVVEPVAGRSGAGRGRRQPELDLQPVRERGCRHHVAARPCAAPRASSRTGSAWTTG